MVKQIQNTQSVQNFRGELVNFTTSPPFHLLFCVKNNLTFYAQQHDSNKSTMLIYAEDKINQKVAFIIVTRQKDLNGKQVHELKRALTEKSHRGMGLFLQLIDLLICSGFYVISDTDGVTDVIYRRLKYCSRYFGNFLDVKNWCMLNENAVPFGSLFNTDANSADWQILLEP